MLVYGDSRSQDVTAALLDAACRGRRNAFFEASELAQGLIDEEFRRRGVDDLTTLHRACLDLLDAVVQAKDATAAGTSLRQLPLPRTIETTAPEGYAFYAVYPEAYARAARRVRWSALPLVIGLRSIGLGLAAVVAAATGGTALTLRPIGHPFNRHIAASAALREKLRAHPGEFAIVDEGPGLSGSSFGAVAALLEGLGIRRERIVFLPSHAGAPGPEASRAIRARWDAVRREVATLDDLLAEHPIAGWFEPIIGPALAVEDLSGGVWRTGLHPPPADPARERRKFRITTAGGAYVARFAGLGRVGAEKLERARALHAAGFAPEPIALHRGFLLQRWRDGCPGITADGPFLDHLARYISFRANAFAADEEAGASTEALAEMIAVNSGLQLQPPPPRPRVHVDGRLHAWEWLRSGGGGFCKLDSIDHSCGHDLVGCQPAEYDVAGAMVEHALQSAQTEQLLAHVKAAGGPSIDPAALPFFRQAYVSFQQGLWSLAEPTPAVLQRRRWLRQAAIGAELAGPTR